MNQGLETILRANGFEFAKGERHEAIDYILYSFTVFFINMVIADDFPLSVSEHSFLGSASHILNASPKGGTIIRLSLALFSKH